MSEYIKAIFKSRPNRFVAEVEVNGKIALAHVPNTGRCKELLIDGVTVYLMPSNDPKRKTNFSLHFVENDGALVSIYSQEANKIVYEAILNGKIKELLAYDIVEREKTVGNSRIDIYLANQEQKNDCYIEVKGVTLIENGVAIFPDAPTERGRKHLE
jgi:sugar fermentation stimulation protein A